MMETISLLFTILAVSYGVIKLTDEIWMKPAEKNRLNDRLTEIWISLDNAPARTVIQAPIRVISAAVGVVYGEHIFSGKAFVRTSGFTLLLFLVVTGIVAVQGGEVFSSLTPGQHFDLLFEIANDAPDVVNGVMPVSLAKRAAADGKAPPTKLPSPQDYSPETKARLAAIVATINSYNNPTNRTVYTLLFPPCALLIVCTLSFFAIAFARRSLEDMAEAKSLVSVFSLGLGNLFFLACFAVVGITLLFTVAIPISWPVIWGLYYVGWHASWLLAVGMLLPLLLLGLFVAPMWIKILAGVIIAPELIVIGIAALALAFYPFKRLIRKIVLEFLERGISYKSGILAFATIALASAMGLAVGISKLLSGKLLP